MSRETKSAHVTKRASDSLIAAVDAMAKLGCAMGCTDEEIEAGAVALAFCNRSPVARRRQISPEQFFNNLPTDAQASYRIRVGIVLAAVKNARPT